MTVAGSAVRRLSPDEAATLGTEIQRRIGVKTSRQEPLARFTTMRVGGPADLFAEVRNLFELRAIVRFARARGLPIFILGRGSDLVISDAGMGGLVVMNRAQQVRIDGADLVADSGLPLAKAATVAKDAGLSGLEFGLAIPGTVGGAVWANAGAHDSDVRTILVEAGVLGADGSESALGPDALGLAYRDSALKAAPEGAPLVVTWTRFHLTPADPAVIVARLDEIRRWRQGPHPPGHPTAGSGFPKPPEGPPPRAALHGPGRPAARGAPTPGESARPPTPSLSPTRAASSTPRPRGPPPAPSSTASG